MNLHILSLMFSTDREIQRQTYTKGGRETDTDPEIERQTDRQTDRQTNRHR